MKREWIDRPENWVEAHGMRMAAHTQQSYMHGKNTKNGRRWGKSCEKNYDKRELSGAALSCLMVKTSRGQKAMGDDVEKRKMYDQN